MNDDLFELPSEALHKRLLKAGAYDESKHPRDEKGRWSAGGVARGALAGAAALGAGALAVRNPAAAGRVVGNVLGATRQAASRAANTPAGAMMVAGTTRAARDLNRVIVGTPRDAALARRLGRRFATRVSAVFGGRTTGLGGRARTSVRTGPRMGRRGA